MPMPYYVSPEQMMRDKADYARKGISRGKSIIVLEYAEGILRLQVTARRPLALDDLRAWDGGADLAPVHVQEDVIEVRLPGAQGF